MASTTPILSPKRARVLTLKQEIAILEMSKKVLQTIYLHPRNGQCPYGNNTFQKGTSLNSKLRILKSVLIDEYIIHPSLPASAHNKLSLP